MPITRPDLAFLYLDQQSLQCVHHCMHLSETLLMAVTREQSDENSHVCSYMYVVAGFNQAERWPLSWVLRSDPKGREIYPKAGQDWLSLLPPAQCSAQLSSTAVDKSAQMCVSIRRTSRPWYPSILAEAWNSMTWFTCPSQTTISYNYYPWHPHFANPGSDPDKRLLRGNVSSCQLTPDKHLPT